MSVLFGSSQFGGAVNTAPIKFLTPPKSQSGQSVAGSSSSSSSSDDDNIELPDALIGQNRIYAQQLMQLDKMESIIQSELYKELKRNDGDMAAAQSNPKIRALMNQYEQIRMELMVQKNHLETEKEQFFKKQKEIDKKDAGDQFFVNNGERIFINDRTQEVLPESAMSSIEEEGVREMYRPMRAQDYERLQYFDNYMRNENGIAIPTSIMQPNVINMKDGKNPAIEQLRKSLEGTENNKSEQGGTRFQQMAGALEGLYTREYSESSNNLNQLNSAVNNFYENMSEGEKLAMRQEFWSNWGDRRGRGPAAVGSRLNINDMFGEKYAETLGKTFGLNQDADGNYYTENQKLKERLYTLSRGLSMKDEHVVTSYTSQVDRKEIPGSGGAAMYEQQTPIGAALGSQKVALQEQKDLAEKNPSAGPEKWTWLGPHNGKLGSYSEDARSDFLPQVSEHYASMIYNGRTKNNPYPNLADITDYVIIENGGVYGKNNWPGLLEESAVVDVSSQVITTDGTPLVRNGKVQDIKGENRVSNHIKLTVAVDGSRRSSFTDKDQAFYQSISDAKEGVEADENMYRWFGFKQDFENALGAGFQKVDEPVIINGKERKNRVVLMDVYVPISGAGFNINPGNTANKHSHDQAYKAATAYVQRLLDQEQERTNAEYIINSAENQ